MAQTSAQIAQENLEKTERFLKRVEQNQEARKRNLALNVAQLVRALNAPSQKGSLNGACQGFRLLR